MLDRVESTVLTHTRAATPNLQANLKLPFNPYRLRYGKDLVY